MTRSALFCELITFAEHHDRSGRPENPNFLNLGAHCSLWEMMATIIPAAHLYFYLWASLDCACPGLSCLSILETATSADRSHFSSNPTRVSRGRHCVVLLQVQEGHGSTGTILTTVSLFELRCCFTTKIFYSVSLPRSKFLSFELCNITVSRASVGCPSLAQ